MGMVMDIDYRLNIDLLINAFITHIIYMVYFNTSSFIVTF